METWGLRGGSGGSHWRSRPAFGMAAVCDSTGRARKSDVPIVSSESGDSDSTVTRHTDVARKRPEQCWNFLSV
jgi:hypothetical protein